MNAQFIFLAQSVVSAVIEIILLVLGAAIIGFLTAWFYQKSVYTPVIKRLEEEKEALNKKIEGLNSDIEKLNGDITGLKKTLAEKDKEIAELKKPKNQ
jgi:peptidoglycan hydrolase CwlO-like protein